MSFARVRQSPFSALWLGLGFLPPTLQRNKLLLLSGLMRSWRPAMALWWPVVTWESRFLLKKSSLPKR